MSYEQLEGFVDYPVSTKRFALKDHHFGIGTNTINLDIRRSLSKGTESKDIQPFRCAVYTIYHSALFLGLDLSFEYVRSTYLSIGITPEDGVGIELIGASGKLGLSAKEIKLNTTADLVPHLRDGNSVFVPWIWQPNWDRPKPEGDGGHLVVISAVDKFGNVLILDSDLRPQKEGANTFGVWWATPEGFENIGYDCSYEGFQMTGDEETILPGANWYHMQGVLISIKPNIPLAL